MPTIRGSGRFDGMIFRTNGTDATDFSNLTPERLSSGHPSAAAAMRLIDSVTNARVEREVRGHVCVMVPTVNDVAPPGADRHPTRGCVCRTNSAAYPRMVAWRRLQEQALGATSPKPRARYKARRAGTPRRPECFNV